MYDGSLRAVDDIRIGDILMGDNSQPRRVLSVTSGEAELYEVRPIRRAFMPYSVTSDHVLSLRCSHTLGSVKLDRYRARAQWLEGMRVRSKSFAFSSHGSKTKAALAARAHLKDAPRTKRGDRFDVKLEDFLALPASAQRYFKGYTVGVEFQDRDVPLDPYLLGLWLGDGDSHWPNVTTIDSEVISYLRRAAADMGLLLKSRDAKHAFTTGTQRGPRGRNPFLNALVSLSLLNNKHIPEPYKINSRDKRLALLAGLVDSDGHVTRGRTIDFTLCNRRLADDIVALARSLGFWAHVTVCKKTCTNSTQGAKTNEYYRFQLGGDRLWEIPTRVPRKQIAKRERARDSLTSLSITRAGVSAYYGFMLDGNGRFLLEDFTVTHNSTELIRLLVRAEVAGKRVGVFKPTIDTRDGSAVASRHGMNFEAESVGKASEILEKGKLYDLVAIDEAQFFDPEIVSVVEKLAEAGKWVIVAGLDLDFRREPFGSMGELMARAEFVEKLQAVCQRCGGPAFFTQRLINGEPAPFSGDTVLVGDAEDYEARCRACFEKG